MTGTHNTNVDLPAAVALGIEIVFRSDADGYLYEYERRVCENGKLLRGKRWTQRFPRDP